MMALAHCSGLTLQANFKMRLSDWTSAEYKEELEFRVYIKLKWGGFHDTQVYLFIVQKEKTILCPLCTLYSVGFWLLDHLLDCQIWWFTSLVSFPAPPPAWEADLAKENIYFYYLKKWQNLNFADKCLQISLVQPDEDGSEAISLESTLSRTLVFVNLCLVPSIHILKSRSKRELSLNVSLVWLLSHLSCKDFARSSEMSWASCGWSYQSLSD